MYEMLQLLRTFVFLAHCYFYNLKMSFYFINYFMVIIFPTTIIRL